MIPEDRIEEAVRNGQAPSDADAVLWRLSRLATIGVHTYVTLTVAGTRVAGQVATQQEYLDGMSKALLKSVDAVAEKQERRNALATFYQMSQRVPDDGKHLHLRHVTISGGECFAWWRLPFRAVDGFAVGSPAISPGHAELGVGSEPIWTDTIGK